jgi:hypothetical protein
MGSLDVQLEEELARYRRQRAGRPLMSPNGLGRNQVRKPLDLIAVNQGARKTQQPALGMSTAPKIEFPLVMVNQAPTDAPPQDTNHEPIDQTDRLEFSASTPTEPTAPLVASSQTNRTARNSTEDVTAPLTSSKTSAGLEGGLVPLAAAQAQPEDYLESSEQLLRSLAQEETRDRSRKPRFTDRFLTPLGVGSLLLLLLSGATLAYIFKNHPSTLSALNPKRFFDSKTTTTAQKPTETTQANTTPTANPPVVKGPNLAAEEFPEVSLDTLSHLEPSPTETPSAVTTQPEQTEPEVREQAPPVVPNTTLPGSSSDISSALLPSPGQLGTVPSTVVPVTPLPPLPTIVPRAIQPSIGSVRSQPLSAPNQSATQQKSRTSPSATTQQAANPATTRGGFYYVVMNYSSDRDLQAAQKVVPDAYVERFPQGARIQMGAFKRESQAKALVEQLKKQGVTASVYHP